MSKQIMVTRSSMPPIEEYFNEIRDLWESHWITNMGEKHNALQQQLSKYLKVQNVELLTNGHMALELSMQALKLPKGGEVITTPFTFASTTHAIVRNNLTPVFCDIDPYDFNIDVDKIESLINDRTCAILPVHVYGSVCNVERIQQIANKYGLKVIYDAAHAFGEEISNRGIGSYGDVSCFSFHATKVFNTIEGGAVCYDGANSEFGQELYRLKNFGIRDEENVDGVGANAKMNEFCAAMGLCNLRHIDECINTRKRLVERYRENLDGIDGIRFKEEQKKVKSNYAYFPIVIDEVIFGVTRNELCIVLRNNGIFARKYFYPLTNTFNCYRGIYDANMTPIALHISKRVLTLPLYADLSFDEVDYICDTIKSCRNSH